MTEEDKPMLLKGGVSSNNEYSYIWHLEPGACEKCQAMDGKVFTDANEIPDKPHPNCKCWIDVRKNESSDPIQNRRDKIREQKDLELEFQKLQGDLKVLEDECDKAIDIIDEELDTIEQFEYTINPEYLKPLDVEKIQEVKLGLNKEKQHQLKIKKDINQLKNEPEFVKMSTKPQLSEIQSYLITFEVLKWMFRKIAEEAAVKIADKNNSTIYGWIHTHISNKMPESYNLFKLGLDWDKYNKKYIEKNGKLLNSLTELNNQKNEKRILKRIQSENPNAEDCKVLILHEDSSISNVIKTSYVFKDFLVKNISNIYRSENLDYAKIEFGEFDNDLYAAFHGAEIYDVHFDNEGNLILRLEDYYNFNPNRTSVKGRVGYKLQEQGDLEPYYIIVIIKIPKDKITKL